jgi:hypothetical protein
MKQKFDIHKIAKKINFPVDQWPGNCYYLALLFVKHKIVNGIARYGHFIGEVDSKSTFYKVHRVTAFVPHGWVELPDGKIVDPTRYVFESKEPYIYEGTSEDYDIGGSSIRDAMRKSMGCPAHNPNAKNFFEFKLPDEVIKLMRLICEDEREGNVFCGDHVFWLGNANPKEFGIHAKSIYKEFKRLEIAVYIPQDYWELVMEQMGYSKLNGLPIGNLNKNI